MFGPQASGLMVGKAGFIEAARQNGAPYQRWARAMKVGKEEIAGLVAAVTRFVSLDHAADYDRALDRVRGWFEAFAGLDGISSRVEACNSAGQSIPRLHVVIERQARAKQVLDLLSRSSPRIVVLPDIRNGVEKGFWVTPELLTHDQAIRVRDVVREALAASA